MSTRLHDAPGARALEERVIARLDELLGSLDVGALGRPVRVVVPSRSLRQHLLLTIARHRGRATAGLLVQTLYGLALEACGRADRRPPHGRALFDVLCRRLAAAEPALSAELGHLADGYGAVAATLRDLFDAGFDSAKAAPLRAALAGRSSLGHGAGRDRRRGRARGLIRVADRVAGEMATLGIGTRATLLDDARRLIAGDAARFLPSHTVLVHGFADATGAATELLATLVAELDAEVFLDRPPDPAGGNAGSGAFGRRFRERLGVASPRPGAPPGECSQPPPELLAAPGVNAEVRAVAERIRRAIDGGADPERVGIVARQLEPYRSALRIHLRRLGVPFSGVGERGPLGPVGRRAGSLAILLQRRGDTPTERWLDALVGLPARTRHPGADLRLAFHTMGAGRVRDVARLDATSFLDRDDNFALLVREGLWADELDTMPFGAAPDEPGAEADAELDEGERDDIEPAADERPQPRAVRRRVPGAALRAVIQAARELTRRLDSWPREAELRVHIGWLDGLCRQDLGWGGTVAGGRAEVDMSEVSDGVAELVRDLPPTFRLSSEELTALVSPVLTSCGRPPIGGRGGGVQVLNVMEARARTFAHLYVLGLNRDVFPRVVREDPLLPDELRQRMLGALPDLPIKRAPGYDEEHFLFAQLLSSSAAVTLSWQGVDERGRSRAPSPLVERLRWSGVAEVEVVADIYSTRSRTEPELLTADEHAVRAGLYGARAGFGAVFPVAVQESVRELGRGAPAGRELAPARLRVLGEIDPDRRTVDGARQFRDVGPYHGFLGPVRAAHDPRNQDLWVTTLEKVVACGWQHVLEGMLRLEPLPDPLGALPSVEPLLLGEVVHAVLERVATEGRGERERRLDRARAEPARAVPWPEPGKLAALLYDESSRVVRAAVGTGFQGLARLYAELALPFVEVAHEVDWRAGEPVAVVGAELEGQIELPDGEGRPRRVGFRVDRVDRSGERLRLTDYKTGRTLSVAVKLETRRKKLLGDVSRGQRLQPVAYALFEGGDASRGRLLFLRPSTVPHAREFDVDGDNPEFADALRYVARDVFRAWDGGSFFPRLTTPDGSKESERCRYCRVAEACVRGDSGARSRIVEWVKAQEGRHGDLDLARRAMVDLWWVADGRREVSV